MVSIEELQLLDKQFTDYVSSFKLGIIDSIRADRKISLSSSNWSPEPSSNSIVIYLYIGFSYHREYDAYRYDLADR